MVRKKVPLQYIGQDSTRRRTYETRRNYLMKKVGELGILCNTKACVLVYDEGASEPDVYPSHAEAVAILNKYKATPNMPQFKKVMSQEEFLTKCLTKLQNQANKLQSEKEDRMIRILLHKAMISGNLNAEEVAMVGCKSGKIHKSLIDCIAKINPQPQVFQPQAPYATDNIHMGSSSMYQAPPQQQAGWPSPVLQAQVPNVTDSMGMAPVPMYQAPLQQQVGWQPPIFQPPAPNVTDNIDMGPPSMYQAPPQQQEGLQLAPNVIDNVDMGPPPLYQAPLRQQEEGWQPPVFLPHAPKVTGSIDMGPPPMYQASSQQEDWQPSVFQPQAPNFTGNTNMGPPPMYQASLHQQEGWQPPVFHAQAPNIIGNINMGSPSMYQAPPQQQEGWQPLVLQPQAPNVTGNVDVVPPQMYQAPHQQQEGWHDTVRSRGDHGTPVYNGYSTGGQDGVGASSSACFPDSDMIQFLDDMDFGL